MLGMPRNDLDRTTMALPIVSSTPCNITKSRHVKTSGRRQVSRSDRCGDEILKIIRR